MLVASDLRSKITLATSLLVFAIIAIVAGFTYSFWHAELRKTISTHQDALVSALARQLDHNLLSAQEHLRHFSKRIDRHVLKNPSRFQAVMDQEDEISHLFDDGLMLLSSTGSVIAQYPTPTSNSLEGEQSEKIYFKQTIASGKAVISAPIISSSSKKYIIAFTMPIFGENGGIDAVLVGWHPLDSELLLASLRDHKIGTSGYLFIINGGRQLVLHPEQKRIGEVIAPDINQGIELALKEFDGTLENVNSKGVKALSSFKHLHATDWILGAHIPLAEAYAPLNRSLGFFLIVLFAGLLLSIILSRHIMTRLLAPLHALTKHVRDFPAKRGNEHVFPVLLPDEIGQLGEAFNKLITQLDEQSLAFRDTADMYRVVAEFDTELAFWRGENGAISYVSPNCKYLTGYTQNEFYACPELLDKLVHSDDQLLWAEHRRAVSEGGPCGLPELRISSKDGTVKSLSHICHKVFGEQGEPQGTRGSFVDITMIKQMQQAMEDEKRFFKSLIQNAAAPIFVIDRTHTIISWNNAIARLTGRSSFQMVGTKRQWEPFYPSKRPVLADLVLDHKLHSVPDLYTHYEISVFQDGSFCAEGWYDNLGGERRFISFEAAPIFDAHQEIIAVIETIQDITNRKQAQEAVNRHNLFLQEILDAVPSPVFYKNVDGIYIGCNKAFLAFLGRATEEVIGKTGFDVLPEEQAAVNEAQERRIISGQGRCNYESVVRRCDGLDRLLLQTKAVFSVPDGTVGGVVGTFVDITEQRLMDEQVRKMSLALEQSPSSIVITDISGTIEYVNPAFCRVTGYTLEEAIGNSPRILKSGQTAPEEYEQLWSTLRSGRMWRGEFHNRRKDGRLYWESVTICPLTDKDGDITNFLAVKEDVTGRKEAEQALAQSQMELLAKHQEMGQVLAQVAMAKQEWEETLDSLKDFVILTDAGHKVRRCNRLLCDITGKKFDQVINHDWRELLVESGFVFINFDGSLGELMHQPTKRLYDLNIYTIKESGTQTETALVISLNDITEIRAMTEELRRTSQELNAAQRTVYQQEKLASIGQLAAGVAHEINNPMGFISSNLSTLNKYLDRFKQFIAAQERLILAIDNAGDIDDISQLRRKLKIDMILDDTGQLISESLDGAARVRRIVQDLKSFSRVDQTECSIIDLNESLDMTINIAWNEIKYTAILNREFGELPQLKCYPQQLNQVFLNLLMNAAQALQKQGEITIRTWSNESDVFVSVSDTGSGMPPEVVNRIFEPFFTTKEVGKGTGLGLSISYDIIRKHHGNISVESQPGAGTTFTVRLPLDGVEE